jgi:hypothetical protein
MMWHIAINQPKEKMRENMMVKDIKTANFVKNSNLQINKKLEAP